MLARNTGHFTTGSDVPPDQTPPPLLRNWPTPPTQSSHFAPHRGTVQTTPPRITCVWPNGTAPNFPLLSLTLLTATRTSYLITHGCGVLVPRAPHTLATATTGGEEGTPSPSWVQPAFHRRTNAMQMCILQQRPRHPHSPSSPSTLQAPRPPRTSPLALISFPGTLQHTRHITLFFGNEFASPQPLHRVHLPTWNSSPSTSTRVGPSCK